MLYEGEEDQASIDGTVFWSIDHGQVSLCPPFRKRHNASFSAIIREADPAAALQPTMDAKLPIVRVIWNLDLRQGDLPFSLPASCEHVFINTLTITLCLTKVLLRHRKVAMRYERIKTIFIKFLFSKVVTCEVLRNLSVFDIC